MYENEPIILRKDLERGKSAQMLEFHPGEAKVTNKQDMSHEKKPVKGFSPTTVLTWQNGPANRAREFCSII